MVEGAETTNADPVARRSATEGGAVGSTGYVALEAVGLTLLGVLVNLGVMVGLAVHGAWFVRIAAGIAAPLALTLLIKGAHARAGAMKHLADWLTH